MVLNHWPFTIISALALYLGVFLLLALVHRSVFRSENNVLEKEWYCKELICVSVVSMYRILTMTVFCINLLKNRPFAAAAPLETRTQCALLNNKKTLYKLQPSSMLVSSVSVTNKHKKVLNCLFLLQCWLWAQRVSQKYSQSLREVTDRAGWRELLECLLLSFCTWTAANWSHFCFPS